MARRPRNASPADPADTPDVPVPGGEPVRTIAASQVRALGDRLASLFTQYRSDRVMVEQRWLRNQRQYLGVYDPEVEADLSANRSRAYPRLTRVKCISIQSRLMNLMFPGNERNWDIDASPSPDLTPQDVMAAIREAQQRDREAGVPAGQPAPPPTPGAPGALDPGARPPAPVDDAYVEAAIRARARKDVAALRAVIDDQLQELGGDQSMDYIALNRKVVASGALYGIGLLRGPFVKTAETTRWSIDPATGQPVVARRKTYKPVFEHLPVWDFYPDLSAKTLAQMDGYFVRSVMSRSQVRALANREDFFGDLIRDYLARAPVGNYKPQQFETELRMMGVKVNVNEMKTDSGKYEVIAWHGPVAATMLRDCGVEIDDDKLGDEVDAEVWMIEGQVIKADINPWLKLGQRVQTLHAFLFDEDDTSPVGSGVPNVLRDTQMALCSSVRMMLDNASVVCGPNLELNRRLLMADQDLTSTTAYKFWYRDDEDPLTAQYPAVRSVDIKSYIPELQSIVKMFMELADVETFVGPATGGDLAQMPSEPMRTTAGASMIRGDAALPFKDIVRQFDRLTTSVIASLVAFNRQFNADVVKPGDYNVLARGATSLIAKELRALQVDQLMATLTPEDQVYIDHEKLLKARFSARDLDDMLAAPEDIKRAQAQAAQRAAQAEQMQRQMAEAELRKLLSDAFKNIAQGRKNEANADAATVRSSLDVLEQGLDHAAASTAQQPLIAAPVPDNGPGAVLGGPPQQPGGGGADALDRALAGGLAG